MSLKMILFMFKAKDQVKKNVVIRALSKVLKIILKHRLDIIINFVLMKKTVYGPVPPPLTNIIISINLDT